MPNVARRPLSDFASSPTAKVPPELEEAALDKKAEMLERLADVDEELAEYYLSEEEPPLEATPRAPATPYATHRYARHCSRERPPEGKRGVPSRAPLKHAHGHGVTDRVQVC